jgi:hypothetical protein
LRQLTTGTPALLHSLPVRSAIMLILKGNFVFSKLLAGIGAVLMLTALTWMGAQQVQAAPTPRTPPDVVAAEFYGWYLETLGADQDPLSDRHSTFNNYVASELVARLVERVRLHGGRVPDTDYFLQSAGYQTVWQRHVAATTVRQRGGGADVIVTLGEETGPRRVLALSMVREAGIWKIRQVVLAEARVSKSSAEQPGI